MAIFFVFPRHAHDGGTSAAAQVRRVKWKKDREHWEK